MIIPYFIFNIIRKSAELTEGFKLPGVRVVSKIVKKLELRL